MQTDQVIPYDFLKGPGAAQVSSAVSQAESTPTNATMIILVGKVSSS